MKKFSILFFSFMLINSISAQTVDSIIDIRDGQVYKIVEIGQQWWMQENLNIGNRINSTLDASNNRIIEKYCYNNDLNNCNVYGGFYQWNEMMDYHPSDNRSPGITQGVCPAGWHLPTDNEWYMLTDFWGGESISGSKIKETDEDGFNALLSGYRIENGGFPENGMTVIFWSTTETNDSYAWSRYSFTGSDFLNRWGGSSKIYGFPIRCIKDFSQFTYLVVSDLNFTSESILSFYGYNISKELLVINSSTDQAINISSIYSNNSVFDLQYSTGTILSGDTIHLTITFNPPVKEIYQDTLFIASNDPYDTLITIPLIGTFPPEVKFADSTNISCNGYSNGSATVTTSLGTPPYKYQWDDPTAATDSAVSGLSANTWYHINVTDDLGWTVRDSISLSQPELLIVQSDYSEFICPQTSNGFIYLNPEGGTPPYSYSWSNGAETRNISGLSSGNYNVTVTDSHGCENSKDFTINNAVPYESEKICIVTVDLISGKNIIVWEKTSDSGIAAYNLYREFEIGQYEYIGSKNVNELSIFRDETADPESRAYLYKITITDTCGNESDINSSRYHRPSFLQYVSSVGGINLSWTDYRIEGIDNIGNYLASYVIYRGTDSTGLTEYETVGSINNYTDQDPDALVKRYYYRVAGVLKNPCYPTAGKKADSGPYSHSMSNIEDNRILVGFDEIQVDRLSVNPVPFSDRTVISFNNPEGHAYTLYLTDLSGKVCRIVDNISTSVFNLERENLNAGFYTVELRGDKVYRGRIIVE